MVRRIILENYMSHRKTVIEPAPGLTVLVGPNNCGKSAVVSALQTLCGDNAGNFMVRHGERTCQVTVETDDGHVITWRRKGGSVTYVIDGREVHRSGRGNLPDDLHEHLRLAKVEAGTGDSFDVHFALQKSPIFLIDNEGRAAAFFSTSSDAERLLEVQKLHKSRVAEANTRQKQLSADLSRLDRELESLAGIDAVDATLKDAERTFDDLTAEGSEIAARGKLLESVAQCERSVGVYSRRCEALRPLASPPDLADDVALEGTIVCLDGARRALDGIRRRSQALAALEPPPALADELPLDRMCTRLAMLHGQISVGRRSGKVLSSLQDPPDLPPTSPLEETIRRLDRADESARRARSHHVVLAPIRPPPDEQDTAPLERFIQFCSKAAVSASGLRNRVAQIGAELEEVAGEVRRWCQLNPTCPLCGAPADADRVLAGEHAHG